MAKLMKIADKESAQRQKDYIAAAKAAKEAKLKQIEDVCATACALHVSLSPPILPLFFAGPKHPSW